MQELPFEVEKLNANIILVIFDDQHTMCDTLVRIQEHYEHPILKGKSFTLGRLRQLSIEEKGVFDYNFWVDGMNFPSSAISAFITGLFDPLTEAEDQFIDLVTRRTGDYYVIAVYKGYDEDTLEHEKCHALYGTNDLYMLEVDEAISDANYVLNKGLIEWLNKEGYHDAVVLDEVNAYLVADSKYLKEEGIEFDEELAITLQEIRSRYKINEDE